MFISSSPPSSAVTASEQCIPPSIFMNDALAAFKNSTLRAWATVRPIIA